MAQEKKVEAGAHAIGGNSERRIQLLKEEGGKVVYLLDAARLQVLHSMEHGLFQRENGFLHAWKEHYGEKAWIRGQYKVLNDNSESSNVATRGDADAKLRAFYDYSNGLHASKNAVLLLGNNHATEPGAPDYSNGLVSPREDAVPFIEMLLGRSRAAEQGAHYSDGLAPSPENVMAAGEASRASRSSTCAVQVSIDAAVGAKAGDLIAVGVKAAGADAGHEHANLSGVVGTLAASLAVTAIAAGGVGPVTAFGLFVVLVGGLSLAMASVRAP